MQFTNPFKNAKLYKYPYGDLIQPFGTYPEIYARLGMKGHNGWDLVKPYGTPLFAVCNGEIVDIKFTPEGFGRHIRLVSDWENNNCWEVTYGHLAYHNPLLKIGDKVKKGDLIGYMGNSGCVVSGGLTTWGDSNPDKEGTHLHLGVREYSNKDTGWQSCYGNKCFFVKNYDNGFKGAISPAEFFKEEIVNQGFSIIETIKKFLAAKIVISLTN